MNGLNSVVDALTHIPRRKPISAVAFSGKSKTDALRNMLRAGEATSAEMSERSGLPRALVTALLNRDIRKGRVLVRDGIYRLAPDYDEQEASLVRSAIQLLKARGYKVTRR